MFLGEKVNGILAAALVVAETIAERHGVVLPPEEMPDFLGHPHLCWVVGRKWFDLPRLKDEVVRDLHLYPDWNWETITDYLAERVKSSSFFDETGRLHCSPRHPDPTGLL